MANPYRGEVALTVNGESHVLRLTLGALAEMETAMNQDSLLALVERFETGAFCANDLILLLYHGLRGGGWDGTPEALAAAEIEGGPLVAARTAGQLLRCAFGPPE